MKITTTYLRQVIKEELEAVISEKANPEEVDPKRFPMKLSQVDKDTAAANVKTGSEKYDEMASDDSIPVAAASIPVKDLKPSQSSMNIGKALGMAISMINKSGPFKGGPGGNLGAFISNDNYIMDGHHRWIASFMVDPNAEVGGYIVDFPREELIAVLNTMTKGAFGVDTGKAASGGFDQFKPVPLKAALEAFIEKGNEFTKPEEVLNAVETFTGKKGAAAVEAAAGKFSENLAAATLSVPSGSPERPDMPVIDSKNVAKAVEMLTQGTVDVNKPYGDVEIKTEPENTNESIVYDRLKKLLK
jgi:hypothetical protein